MRVLAANDYHQVAVLGDGLRRGLAVAGSVADVLAPRPLDTRKTLPQNGDDLGGFVHGERGLGDEGEPVRLGRLHAARFFCVLDEGDSPRGELAHGTDHLVVPSVADHQNVPGLRPGAGEAPLGLAVDLAYQGASGIEVEEVAALRL